MFDIEYRELMGGIGMKKVLISILVVGIFMFMGCSGNKGSLETVELENINIEENLLTRDNELIYERYKNVDNKNLKYEIVERDYYFYEIDDSFVGSAMLDEIPKINDKKYSDILLSYTFCVDINPTLMTYDQAINYAKELLPDDIKEDRVKYDDKMNKLYIVYSSSQGEFIVGLCMGTTEDGKIDKNSVIGLNYKREIKTY